jgi:hypothetical protein
LPSQVFDHSWESIFYSLPVTQADQAWWQKYQNWEGAESFAYANSPIYLLQAARNLHLIYHDPTILLTITKRNHEWIIIVHRLQNVASLLALSQLITQKTGEQIIIAKIGLKEKTKLLKAGFAEYSSFALTDDFFPEVLISLTGIEDLGGGKLMKVRQKVAKAQRDYGKRLSFADLCLENSQDARAVVEAWAEIKLAENPSGAFTKQELCEPYYPFLFRLSGIRQHVPVIATMLYLDHKPVGFGVLGEISEKCMGQYANLVCLPITGLFDLLAVTGFRKAKQLGYQLVNLGGSEEEGLHNFKLKFNWVAQMNKYWVEGGGRSKQKGEGYYKFLFSFLLILGRFCQI